MATSWNCMLINFGGRNIFFHRLGFMLYQGLNLTKWRISWFMKNRIRIQKRERFRIIRVIFDFIEGIDCRSCSRTQTRTITSRRMRDIHGSNTKWWPNTHIYGTTSANQASWQHSGLFKGLWRFFKMSL